MNQIRRYTTIIYRNALSYTKSYKDITLSEPHESFDFLIFFYIITSPDHQKKIYTAGILLRITQTLSPIYMKKIIYLSGNRTQ
jgi:hypothetical protein